MADVKFGIDCARTALDGVAEHFRGLGDETFTGEEIAEFLELASDRMRRNGQLLDSLAEALRERQAAKN